MLWQSTSLCRLVPCPKRSRWKAARRWSTPESGSVSTVIDETLSRVCPKWPKFQHAAATDAGSGDCALEFEQPGAIQHRGPADQLRTIFSLMVFPQILVCLQFFGLGTSGTGAAQAFSALGGTSSLVSVEALQEFRIETSSFAPEFGRSPGGQVILTTRSGTNDFHGGIYEYFRNNVLDANDWFADQAGQPTRAERHNDFGGFLGGPIERDRLSFSFPTKGARLRQPNTTIVQVPSEYARIDRLDGDSSFPQRVSAAEDRTRNSWGLCRATSREIIPTRRRSTPAAFGSTNVQQQVVHFWPLQRSPFRDSQPQRQPQRSGHDSSRDKNANVGS